MATQVGQLRYSIGFDIKKQDLNSLKTQLQQLQKLSYSDFMKINNTNFENAKQILKDVRTEAEHVQGALNKAFNAKLGTYNVQTFKKELNGTSGSIQNVYNTLKQAGAAGENAFRTMTNQVLNTNIQLKESHTTLNKIATTLSNSIKWGASSAVINGMTRSVQQAWGFVKSLDTSLNDIMIVTGKSADEMARFSTQATKAAKALGKTTVDYTKASLIYAQQGLSDKEIAARAAITLKAANVTGQSTDQVSEQLTSVWNGYKVSAEQAEIYIDRLAAVAANTASNLEQLSTGMSKVAAAAAAMGVGQDQLAAQLSTIISVTRQAPESVGTALRTVYARISDIKAGIDEDGVTLGNYSGKMAELGFNVLDVNGKLRDMGEVMEEIGGKWASLTREQQVSLAQTMAGQRQYSNLIALFDNFTEYNRALSIAQNSAGTLQKQQDTYMESTRAHLNQLKTSVEQLYKILVNPDSLEPLIDKLNTVVSGAAKFIDILGGGKSLLLTLGSIAFTVLSKNIAQGINTSISNFEKMKMRITEINSLLNTVQEWKGIQGLDGISKQLFADRENLLRMASVLSPKQFQGLQKTINELTEIGNKFASIKQEKAFYESYFHKSLKDIADDDDAQQKILSSLDEQIQLFPKAATKLKEYGAAFRQMNQTGVNGSNFDQLRKEVGLYIKSLSGIAKINPFLNNHKEQINDLATEFENLKNVPTNQLPQKLNDMVTTMSGLFTGGANSANEYSEKLKQNFRDVLTQLGFDEKQIENLFNKMSQSYQASMEVLNREAAVQGVIKMATGVSQLGAAINQLKNIGDIFSDKSLSGWDKFGKIIIGLVASLPLLINGSATLTQGFLALKAATLMSAGASAADAVAKTTEGLATDAATAAQIALNAAVLAFPGTWVVVAIAAVVAAISVYIAAAKKARQEQRRLNQQVIQSEKAKKEELKNNEKLYDSLEELNKKYKQGEITRTELKSSIEELVDTYGLQGTGVENLIHQYQKLNQVIKQQRLENAQQMKQANDIIIRKSKANIMDKSHNDNPGYVNGNTYHLDISKFGSGAAGTWGRIWQSPLGAFMNLSLPNWIAHGISSAQGTETLAGKYIKEALGNMNSKDGIPNGIGVSFEYSLENLQEFYKRLTEAREKIQQDKNIQLSDPYYQAIVKQISILEEDIANLEQAQKQDKELLQRITILKSDADFFNIDSLEAYTKQRQIIIKQLQQQNKYDLKDAAQAADNYLKNEYRSLYVQFNQISKYIDNIKSKFGEKTNTQIQNLLSTLDDEHLFWFMDVINLKDISTWEDLESIIKEISNIDLSNIETFSNLDQIRARKLAAGENYTVLQDIEKQLKSGKTLTSKVFDNLIEISPQIKQHWNEFFAIMGNGQYKLINNAEKFYQIIDSLKIQDFYNNYAGIGKTIQKVQNISKIDSNVLANARQENYDVNNFAPEYQLTEKGEAFLQLQAKYSDLSNSELEKEIFNKYKNNSEYVKRILPKYTDLSNADIINNKSYTYKYDLIQEQANLLKEINSQNQAMQVQIDSHLSKALHSIGQERLDAAEWIRNQVEEQLKYADVDLEELEKEKLETLYQIHDALFPTDSDIDQSILAEMTKVIQELSDESDQLSNKLNQNTRTAEDVAEAILRFDNAINDVVKNYDTWLDVLDDEHSSLQQIAQILQPLRDAYADLLGGTGQSLSSEFLQSAENLKLMKQAADGSLEAYEQLRINAADDIIAHIYFDSEAAANNFITQQEKFRTQLEKFFDEDPINLKIGAEISPELQKQMQDLVNSAKMTADQAQEYLLEAFGIDAKVVNETKEETSNEIWQGAEAQVSTETIQGATPLGSRPTQYVIPSIHYNPVPQKIQHKKTVTGTALQVIGANRSAGGEIKWKNSSQGAGAAGTTRRAQASKSKIKSKKEPTKKQKDDRDIYHDINIELKQINRELTRQQNNGSKLAGADLIKSLNKQLQILTKQKVKLQQKNALQKLDLQNQKQQLKLLGVTFDEYGHITNYLDIMGNKIGTVNGYIEAENALIAEYNAATDKDAQEAIQERLTEVQRQRKDAEDAKKDLESAIKDYDTLMDDIESVTDQITAATQKRIQIQISKFKMKIELTLDMRSLQQQYNEFLRNVTYADDLFRTSSGEKLYKNANKDFADYQSYYDVDGVNSIANLTQAIKDARQKYEQTGNKEYLDSMKQYVSQLENSMANMKQIEQSIQQAYLDTMQDIDAQADRQIEQYEYLEDQLRHDIDLVTLIYGQHQYDAMDQYYNQLRANHEEEISFLRSYADELWQSREQAILNGETEVAEEYLKLWQETNSKLNEELKESIEDAKNQYLNAIDKIYYQLELKLTGNKGLDYMQMQWQLINKNADQYLDSINAAYAVQQLERKFQKAIDTNKNVKSQKQLTNLMNQQLDYLKAKDKLTQYDVDRAEKLLNIEQARLDLENIRNSKTSLRLKRDSQGNYSYVYAADNNKVDDAAAKLAQLQNELYNFDKDAYKDNLSDILAATREYLEKRKQLQTQYNLADEEQKKILAEKLKLLDDNYYEYLQNKAAQNAVIRVNLQSSASQEYKELYKTNHEFFDEMTDGNYASFEQMSDSVKAKLMDDLVPGYQGGIQEMINKFYGESETDTTSFRGACLQAWSAVDEATNAYEETVHTLADKAGIDLGGIKKGVDDVANAYKDLIPKNDAVLNGFKTQKENIDQLIKKLDALKLKNKDVWDAAVTQVGEATTALKDYLTQLSKALDMPSPGDDNYNGTPTLPTAPVGSGTGIETSSGNGGGAAPEPNTKINVNSSILERKQRPSQTLIDNLAGAVFHGMWGSNLNESSLAPLLEKWGTAEMQNNSFELAYFVFEQLAKNVEDHWKDIWRYVPYSKEYLYDKEMGISDDYYYVWNDITKKMKKVKKSKGGSNPIGTSLSSYDTGGYTGEWGPSGRLAMLHQKQLVLNATDTKNILNSVAIIRDMFTGLSGSIFNKLNSLNGGYSRSITSQIGGQVDQNVSIQASFPNVNSKKEIEDAFTELVNLAAQRAMRR